MKNTSPILHYVRICFFLLLSLVLVSESQPVFVNAAPKRVYLTFDDGPSERYTPVILDILRREHIHATFFVLGFRTEMYPKTARRIHIEGHEIGNHGFYHTHLTGKSTNFIMMDVAKADTAITAVCGVKPFYFRPPGGLLDPPDWKTVRKMGYHVALWTVDTEDWKARNEKTIIDSVINKTKPGSIILMHDGVSGSFYTTIALPKIIHYLKAQGYIFEVLPTNSHSQ
jgi:peptidoglycan-N-acetylglucosamine deacetylase